MPPDERRPGPKTEAARSRAGEDLKLASTMTHGGDITPEVEARAGNVVRVTRREVTAVCRSCPARFDSTGPAASHARSSRHTVSVSYSAEFLFAAAETLGGVR